MSPFVISIVSGIVTSIIAAYIWELRAQSTAYSTARKLVGTWDAYNIEGRIVSNTPMPGAGDTVVSLRSRWWVAEPPVLDFRSQDIDPVTKQPTRKHDGTIVPDPVYSWLATRIDRYPDSNEVSLQQLQIDPSNSDIVLVFPDPKVATIGDNYGKHAWRRRRGK